MIRSVDRPAALQAAASASSSSAMRLASSLTAYALLQLGSPIIFIRILVFLEVKVQAHRPLCQGQCRSFSEVLDILIRMHTLECPCGSLPVGQHASISAKAIRPLPDNRRASSVHSGHKNYLCFLPEHVQGPDAQLHQEALRPENLGNRQPSALHNAESYHRAGLTWSKPLPLPPKAVSTTQHRILLADVSQTLFCAH